MTNDQLIQQAIQQAKAGNKVEAKRLLSQVVRQDSKNARAWYLLSQVVDNKEQSIYCLEKVLEIEPDNMQAAERLVKLRTPPQTAPPRIPTQSISHQQQPAPQKVIVVQEKKKNRLVSFLAALSLVIILCLCITWILGVDLPSSQSHEVVYRVTGTTNRASLTLENAQGGTQQFDVVVPWEAKFTIKDASFLYISAQNSRDHGSITCEILVDGERWKVSQSSGAYVIASCSGWYLP